MQTPTSKYLKFSIDHENIIGYQQTKHGKSEKSELSAKKHRNLYTYPTKLKLTTISRKQNNYLPYV